MQHFEMEKVKQMEIYKDKLLHKLLSLIYPNKQYCYFQIHKLIQTYFLCHLCLALSVLFVYFFEISLNFQLR